MYIPCSEIYYVYSIIKCIQVQTETAFGDTNEENPSCQALLDSSAKILTFSLFLGTCIQMVLPHRTGMSYSFSVKFSESIGCGSHF